MDVMVISIIAVSNSMDVKVICTIVISNSMHMIVIRIIAIRNTSSRFASQPANQQEIVSLRYCWLGALLLAGYELRIPAS